MTQFMGAQRTKLIADYSKLVKEKEIAGHFNSRFSYLLIQEFRRLTIDEMIERTRRLDRIDSFCEFDEED